MNEQLIAYMTWDRLVAWKILSLNISEGKEKLIPIGYGSRQKIFKKYARAGSTIWVFSMPSVKLPGQNETTKYRPTLVARIKIKDHVCSDNPDKITHQADEIKKLLRYWGYVAIADTEESSFFELNDATETLISLEFQSSKGKSQLFDSPLKDLSNATEDKIQFIRLKMSQKLQSVRRLIDSNQNFLQELEGLAEKVSRQKVFISYAHNDGREFPIQLADAFLDKNWSPWIDSLAIPPKSGRKSENIPPKRLMKLLEFGIKGSSAFVAWKSDKYTRSERKSDLRWTMKEWNYARQYKKTNSITIVPFTIGAKNKEEDMINLENEDTDSLASKVIDRWQNDQ